MKILEIKSLAIPDMKVIRFARFLDNRGYFSESFRQSDVAIQPQAGFLKDVRFVQTNETFSHKGVVRGLHFQWHPFMSKLVRPLSGHLIDLALDIRKNSPTLGKIIAYDMPHNPQQDFGEWVWVPSGFAHGVVFLEDSRMEYLCSGEYSPQSEAGISPLAEDLDWSLCETDLRRQFDSVALETSLISDKDRQAFSLARWLADPRSENFIM